MRWQKAAQGFLFAASLLVAAPACVWLTWPLWSEAVLRRALAAQQIELIKIDWSRPTWHQLRIHRIVARKPSIPFTLTATDTALAYDFTTLKQGRVHDVDIAQLQFDLEVTPKNNKALSSDTDSTSLPLPADVLKQIPARSIRVRQMQIATPWPDIANWRGNLDLRDDTLSVQLDNTDASQLSLRLRADIANQIDLTLQRERIDILQVRNRFLPAPDHADSLLIDGQVRADVAELSRWLPLPLQNPAGTVQATWRGAMPRSTAADWLTRMQLSGEINAQLRASHALAQQATLDIDGDFTLDNAVLNGVIHKATARAETPMPAAVATHFKMDAKKPLPLSVHTNPETRFEGDLKTRAIRITDGALHLEVGSKTSTLYTRVQFSAIDAMASSPAAIRFKTDIHAPALPMANYLLQPTHLTANVELLDNTLAATWQARDVAKIYALNGTLSYRLDKQSGRVKGQLQPLSFRENGNYLPAIVQPWPLPFDLTGGELRANFDAQWLPAGLIASGTLDMRKLSAFYDRNLIHGVSGVVHVDYRNQLLLPRTQRIHIERIDTGIPIEDVQWGLQATPQRFTVTDFAAQLFGGRVHQSEMIYLHGKPEQTALLHVEGLQLERILALQQNVEGSGVIDGEVPLCWRDGKPSISAAHLQARAPGGVLRYRDKLPASALDNQGLAIAFTALQNFHFNGMDVQGDYAESGDMTLAVALKGRNPEAKDIPPVNFNMTIRQNIPELLQSLQLSSVISDRIEKRIDSIHKKHSQPEKFSPPKK